MEDVLRYAASKADRVRRFFQLGIPFNVCQFVLDLGFDLKYIDLGNSSAFVYCENECVCVFINTQRTFVQNRWDVCHELGHIFCGHRPTASAKAKRLQEIQANAFAEGLILPEEEFLDEMESAKSMSALARRFGTSLQASYYRVDNLFRSGRIARIPDMAMNPPAWVDVSYARKRA